MQCLEYRPYKVGAGFVMYPVRIDGIQSHGMQ